MMKKERKNKKNSKIFTIFVASDEKSSTKRLQFSQKQLYSFMGVLSVIALLTSIVFYDYSSILLETSSNKTLREKNFQLNNKLLSLEGRLVDLERSLHKVKTLSTKLRAITNLREKTHPLELTLGAVEGKGLRKVAHFAHKDESEPWIASEVDAPTFQKTESASDWEGSSLEVRIDEALKNVQLEEIQQAQLLESLSQQKVFLASMPSISPVKGWLSSVFGYRKHPITGQNQMHSGVDIASSFGQEVVAPASGVVSFVGYDPGYGKTFFIDHGYGFQTRYGHLSDIFVRLGERVHRGKVLATVGSTGRSTGPHIHYEVRFHGVAVDPIDYILDFPLQVAQNAQ